MVDKGVAEDYKCPQCMGFGRHRVKEWKEANPKCLLDTAHIEITIVDCKLCGGTGRAHKIPFPLK